MERQRQGDYELEASLGYKSKLVLKIKGKKMMECLPGVCEVWLSIPRVA